MDREIEILEINELSEIPKIEKIQTLSNNKILKLRLSKKIEKYKNKIFKNFDDNLMGFKIIKHDIDAEISFSKLLDLEMVEKYQDFFENCAQKYRNIAITLTNKLIYKYNIKINKENPYLALSHLKSGKSIGVVDDWKYSIYDYQCSFSNKKTNQKLLVSFGYGSELGILDPYYFMKFVKTCPEYKTLPIEIYDEYADGKRINIKMYTLGKFEIVKSNIGLGIEMVVKNKN